MALMSEKGRGYFFMVPLDLQEETRMGALPKNL